MPSILLKKTYYSKQTKTPQESIGTDPIGYECLLHTESGHSFLHVNCEKSDQYIGEIKIFWTVKKLVL